jgi:hypothetical protein
MLYEDQPNSYRPTFDLTILYKIYIIIMLILNLTIYFIIILRIWEDMMLLKLQMRAFKFLYI